MVKIHVYYDYYLFCKQAPSGIYSNIILLVQFSSVQFSRSVVSDSLEPHGLQHARPPCPSPTPRAYSKLMSIESVMPSNHLILCCPLLLPPSFFPSIRVFSNESTLRIRWPKYWSFSFNISPSNEYSGLISFRMYWLGLLAVQGTLKSLLQHHSSKASILWLSAFFIVQFSLPYVTTGKTIALTRWTFVGKPYWLSLLNIQNCNPLTSQSFLLSVIYFSTQHILPPSILCISLGFSLSLSLPPSL